MGDFFSDYQLGDFYDEMFAAPGEPRPHYSKLLEFTTSKTSSATA
jgi:uncharacterized circularly permuted ATP-grasp superfamily protein